MKNGHKLSDITQTAVLQLICQTAYNTIANARWDRPYKAIANNLPTIKQPDSMNKQVKLHDYQLEALTWLIFLFILIDNQLTRKGRMKNVEDRCYQKEYQFSPIVKVSPTIDLYLHVAKGLNHFDFAGQFVDADWMAIPASELQEKAQSEAIRFTTTGGILADEMGLGKTLTVISLIASNPRSKDLTNNKYFPLVSEHKYGKPEFVQVKPVEAAVPIKTTLIICPSQLVAQWGNEIAKHSKLSYKCCTQRGHYQCDDLPDYDVVIVSHSGFFKQKKIISQYCDPAFLRYHW